MNYEKDKKLKSIFQFIIYGFVLQFLYIYILNIGLGSIHFILFDVEIFFVCFVFLCLLAKTFLFYELFNYTKTIKYYFHNLLLLVPFIIFDFCVFLVFRHTSHNLYSTSFFNGNYVLISEIVQSTVLSVLLALGIKKMKYCINTNFEKTFWFWLFKFFVFLVGVMTIILIAVSWFNVYTYGKVLMFFVIQVVFSVLVALCENVMFVMFLKNFKMFNSKKGSVVKQILIGSIKTAILNYFAVGMVFVAIS